MGSELVGGSSWYHCHWYSEARYDVDLSSRKDFDPVQRRVRTLSWLLLVEPCEAHSRKVTSSTPCSMLMDVIKMDDEAVICT